MRRLISRADQHHSYYPAFCSAMSIAMFAINQDDLDKLIYAKHQELKQKIQMCFEKQQQNSSPVKWSRNIADGW